MPSRFSLSASLHIASATAEYGGQDGDWGHAIVLAEELARVGSAGVGMAIAGRWMAAHFNQPGFEDLIDFNVYALCGDGDMMEGLSGEAASLAGHLKLSNLCWIYDNNHITIEGNTALAFSDDVATRFIGYGWNVTRVGDANDLEMLRRAFRVFGATTDRPTLIIVDSHIAYGAPHAIYDGVYPKPDPTNHGWDDIPVGSQSQIRTGGGVQRGARRRRPASLCTREPSDLQEQYIRR